MSSGENGRRWQLLKWLFAFGLACVACMGAAVLALNLRPHLVADALGLEDAGPLEAVLPPESEPLTLAGEAQDRVEIQFPPHVSDPLALTPTELGSPIIGDASARGTTVYLLTIDEAGLNQLLRRRVFPDEAEGTRYRNLQIDLQPGGLVVYADVVLGLRRKRMGLLLLQEGDATVSPAGVVLNQELYILPEEGSLTRLLLPTGREVQRALHVLTVVGPLPGEASVETVRFHPDRLQILARASYPAPEPADTGWQSLVAGVELREIDVAVDPERPTERLRIVRLDPNQVEFRVRYSPGDPKMISTWGAEAPSLLVVNGAYFVPPDEGGGTIGLLVSDGESWGTPLDSYAGMFAVTGSDDVSVRWLEQSPYDPEEPLAQAIQSFPVLVRPGGVMGFPAEADDGTPARRTVVAQDGGGNVLFIVAPGGYLGLHELAVFLAESDLAIDVALNLDGGGSTGMWLAAGDARVEIDSFTPVPSVISVQRR
jgi:hypothetical protein